MTKYDDVTIEVWYGETRWYCENLIINTMARENMLLLTIIIVWSAGSGVILHSIGYCVSTCGGCL